MANCFKPPQFDRTLLDSINIVFCPEDEKIFNVCFCFAIPLLGWCPRIDSVTHTRVSSSDSQIHQRGKLKCNGNP